MPIETKVVAGIITITGIRNGNENHSEEEVVSLCASDIRRIRVCRGGHEDVTYVLAVSVTEGIQLSIPINADEGNDVVLQLTDVWTSIIDASLSGVNSAITHESI